MGDVPARRKGTALITGASAGIGRAFAEEYAARGFDVVLVARREERLRELAAEIAGRSGVTAHVLPADLADPAVPDEILAWTTAQGIAIDALVNNAGFGVPGMLNDVAWDRHDGCIEVMARAPVRLSYLFAPGMAERGRGWIVNVASLAAFVPPHAGGTLYYPVKSFLLQFSLAHREEMRRHGVHVTASCPGFVETEFQQAAGGTVESVSFPRWLWIPAERVARAGIDAVERNKPISIPGRIDRLIAIAFKLMPGPLARWVVRGES